MIKWIEKILNSLMYTSFIVLTSMIFFVLVKEFVTIGGFSCIVIGILLAFVGLFIDCLFLSKIIEQPKSPPPTKTPFTGDDALSCISGKIVADKITRGIHK